MSRNSKSIISNASKNPRLSYITEKRINKLEESTMEKDPSTFDKTMNIIQFPFNWIRRLTIPPSEENDYDNYLVMLWPFFGIPVMGLLALWTIPTTFWWLLYLPFAIIWALIFWKIAPGRKEAPKNFWII